MFRPFTNPSGSRVASARDPLPQPDSAQVRALRCRRRSAASAHRTAATPSTQQNGFVHAGAITTLADSACGYAAMSLQPPDRDILTVEFKVNLMSPAVGQYFRATATVVRSGRNLTVCTAEVVADDSTRTIALMQATLMAVPTS
ncbi:PaaI family thioesterase [Nocardia arthritidis]|uniref:Hotdog fold thioesterase n=1 Tax=Nocardia arthritidis TaxID=228602 RepID=A0A6G9YES5_9NOCA|nr:PaaI family thioesterase [Nocardia arthritidis]QIS11729.1 hotdog fold thioesterase [Nocardia arthritidis]